MKGDEFMGKFIDEKGIVETYINNFINNTTDFSRFIEGSPTFVTYYSKDTLASTNDITLGGVTEIIGVESPIKYNKIENFPIFGLEELDLSTSLDEDSGIDSELQSTATVLPSTIKPLPDDFFMISSINKDYLFKVDNVDPSNINDKVFYKISFHISYEDVNVLEEKQLTKNYKVLYENIGKEAKSIILDSDYASLQDLDEVYETIRDFYIKYFYNKDCNTFFYKNYLYDDYLIRFIDTNQLFIQKRSYMKDIKLTPLENKPEYEFYIIVHTIFKALENNDKSDLVNLCYLEYEINEPNSIMSLYKNKYNINEITYNLASGDKIFPDKFVECIKNNTEMKATDLYEDTTNYSLFNYIIYYLNNKLNVEQYIRELKKYKFDISLLHYILIPCILFILKQSKESILNR